MKATSSRSLMILIVSGLMGQAAWGQDAAVKAEVDAAQAKAEAEKKATEEKKDGWETKLALGTNLSYSTSRSVVGSPDGSTFQFNLFMDGAANLRKGRHQWLNEGKLIHGETQTPLISTLIKSSDSLDIKSTYFYSPAKLKWLGPFARGSLNTSLFEGTDIRSSNLTVVRTNSDGTTEVIEPTADGGQGPYTQAVPRKGEPYWWLPLTTSLEPMILKEVVGVLANPIDRGTKLNVSFHMGVGAEEMFSQGGYVLTDDVKTPEIEIRQLSPYTSVGGELEIRASGSLNTAVSWNVSALLFQPVYSTTGTSVVGLMNKDIAGKVSAKLSKWASLDLVLSAKQYPLVVPDWQVQTGLLLSATFNVI